MSLANLDEGLLIYKLLLKIEGIFGDEHTCFVKSVERKCKYNLKSKCEKDILG